MANVDVIFYLYKKDNVSLDAIVGLGVGVAILNNTIVNTDSSRVVFYSDARVGLGANYDSNRFGLAFSPPIYPATKNIWDMRYRVKTKLSNITNL